MPSKPPHRTPPPTDTIASDEQTESAEEQSVPEAELPVELSQFSQRLASFGLGETPDPLLTESRLPSKRRRRR